MQEKQYHHGHLREAMIEAGIAVISGEGLTQLSMRKVAAHCGVSHAAPYNHFKNKEELLNAIKAHIADGIAHYLTESISMNASDEERLLSFGKNYVRYFVEHPSYYRFIFLQSDFQMTINETGISCEQFELFSSFIDIANDLISKDDEELTISIIAMLAIVNGLISLFIADNITANVDYMKIVDKVLRERLKL